MAVISSSRELSSQEAVIVVQITESLRLKKKKRKVGSYSLAKDNIFGLRN